MREAFFILLVLVVLLGLTAIRYRKQISGIMGLARMLKEAKRASGSGSSISNDAGKAVPLANCSQCGIWIPQTKSIRVGKLLVCSESCLRKTEA